MTFRPTRRESAGAVRRLRRPRLPWRPRVRCKRYNLEVLATMYRRTAAAPYFAQPGTPPGHSSSPARNRPMVRHHPRALPGPAVRANSRRPAPGRFSHVPVKIIRGASGLEFLFINARIGSIGKALNIAPCGNAPGSFDVRSLIRGQISGWPRWPSAEIMPFLAWFLPVDARPRTQPFQGGFVAAIGTEPVVADGRTCL
jgi:hypothetical protein